MQEVRYTSGSRPELRLDGHIIDIDDDMYEKVKYLPISFRPKVNNQGEYLCVGVNGKTLRLATFVIADGNPSRMKQAQCAKIIHLNGDIYDVRRDNLILVRQGRRYTYSEFLKTPRIAYSKDDVLSLFGHEWVRMSEEDLFSVFNRSSQYSVKNFMRQLLKEGLIEKRKGVSGPEYRRTPNNEKVEITNQSKPEQASESTILIKDDNQMKQVPVFVDLTGKGWIVALDAIQRFEFEGALVEVVMKQQLFDQHGRDSKPQSFIFDGKDAIFIRELVNTLLLDNDQTKSAKTNASIQAVIEDKKKEIDVLNHALDKAYTEVELASSEIIELHKTINEAREKLRTIGFDPDRILPQG